MRGAALFDIDGTLVDSVDLHVQAWERAFSHFGKNVQAEAIRGQIGKGGDQLLPVFLDRRERDAFGDELQRFRSNLFVRELLPLVRPFPGVHALFEELHRRGVRCALATSSSAEELQHYGRRSGAAR